MPLILYDMPRSGHAHRVRLLLSLLDVEYEQVMVDMTNGEHKTAEYLKLSPLGQVPTLVDGDIVITDSTAALIYLAFFPGLGNFAGKLGWTQEGQYEAEMAAAEAAQEVVLDEDEIEKASAA